MPEWTCLMRSAAAPAGGSARSAPRLRLRYFRVGGSLATGGPLPRPVVDRLHLDAALRGHAPLRRQVLQRVDGRADHVVGVGGPQALREDVAHAGALEHCAHGSSGDHPSPRRGGLQQHRSEEHTSELQSPCNLVCRLLLENKKSLNSRFKSLDTLKVKIISVTFRRVIRTNHKKASKIWTHDNIQTGGSQS